MQDVMVLTQGLYKHKLKNMLHVDRRPTSM